MQSILCWYVLPFKSREEIFSLESCLIATIWIQQSFKQVLTQLLLNGDDDMSNDLNNDKLLLNRCFIYRTEQFARNPNSVSGH